MAHLRSMAGPAHWPPLLCVLWNEDGARAEPLKWLVVEPGLDVILPPAKVAAVCQVCRSLGPRAWMHA